MGLSTLPLFREQGQWMNRNELRKADINLMVVFETLMLERNVTRAAEKLFLGQPTISSALNRLRTMLNDPLFIRVGHRMEPTARAEDIYRHLKPALDSLSAALSLTRDFDPATSTMTFRIGLSDDVEFGLLPPLLRALRRGSAERGVRGAACRLLAHSRPVGRRRYHRRHQPDPRPAGQRQTQTAAAHPAEHPACRCL